ncbi:MAG: hypothetical protein AAFX51_13935, partial [Cyanobacteria bacterium J06636_28]
IKSNYRIDLIQKLEFLKSDITVLTANSPYELCSLHWDLAWAMPLTSSPDMFPSHRSRTHAPLALPGEPFFAQVMIQVNHEDLQSLLQIDLS